MFLIIGVLSALAVAATPVNEALLVPISGSQPDHFVQVYRFLLDTKNDS